MNFYMVMSFCFTLELESDSRLEIDAPPSPFDRLAGGAAFMFCSLSVDSSEEVLEESIMGSLMEIALLLF